MSRVFISYRRADSNEWATKLYRHLGMRFGSDLIFRDVADIKPGADFLDTLRHELASCEVFLVLIGRYWLIDAQGRRRLDDGNDVLRMEITEALLSKGVVLPVLLAGATMPSRDALPEPLKKLADRQAATVSDMQWAADVAALIERVREIILPRAGDIRLPQAEKTLLSMQLQYFTLLDGGNPAEALELAQKTQGYLDKVLPLYAQDPTLKVTRGYLFKNEAMALLDLERDEEAAAALDTGESIFRTILDERPRDAAAWNGLGSIESVRGNDAKAHEYVDEALRILPTYPFALEDHANILAQLGLTSCEVVDARGRPIATHKRKRRAN